jgi:predicted DNA-binding transcriptional regulator YafY
MTRNSPTKLQRWLDLIAFLVGRRLPVAVEELMEKVPAYAEKWNTEEETARATARRTFERDKDELRRAGIPIRTVSYSIGQETIEGYRIDRRDFYLPYLKLLATGIPARRALLGDPARIADVEISPAHIELIVDAAQRVASSPSFPLADEARSALRKLTFDLGRPPRESPVLFVERPDAPQLRDRLRVLSDSLLLRKRVHFRYHGLYRDQTTDRAVAPYGLLYHKGHWYLIGHDDMRNALRVFRVGRMQDVERNMRVPNSADYDIPPDFRIEDHIGRRAWELGDAEEPVLHAHVLFHFPLALWAERNAYGELVDQRQDGSAVRTFDVQQVDPFLRWLLSCAGEAEIVQPAELRDAYRAMANAVYDRHATAPEVSGG